MNTLYTRLTRAGFLSSLPLLAATSGALGQSCWSEFVADLCSCNTSVMKETRSCWGPQSVGDLGCCNAGLTRSSSTPDPDAHTVCLSDAQMKLSGCVSGGNGAALLDAWKEFNDRLRECLQLFPENEAARQASINGALNAFRIRVRVILGLDPDPFPQQGGQDGRGVQFGWPWLAACGAVEPDGVLRIEADSALWVIGGLRRKSDSYSFAPLNRAASTGILLVIHETTDGFESYPIDATTDIQAGIHFNAHFAASRHVHSDRVHLMGVYFDEQGVPVAAQMDEVLLHDSPVAGDWNRDGVANFRDIQDFVKSYNAEVRRADLNADGVVNKDDLLLFLTQSSS